MASKGKEREVVREDTLSDESDTDFFTAPTVVHRQASTTVREPSPIVISSSDDDESPKKRRRLRSKPKPTRSLPEWTRAKPVKKDKAGSREPSAGRGGERDEAIVLLSDDESPKDKSPARESNGRARVELTPPPQLKPEAMARLRQNLDMYFEENTRQAIEEAAEQQASHDPSSSRASVKSTAKGMPVEIRVRFVADPARKEVASAKAIEHYERLRVIHIPQNEQLQTLVDSLADRMEKQPHEIVLVYKGQRIYAYSKTPGEMGIYESADMEGYETVVWDKIQREKEEQRRRVLMQDQNEEGTALRSPTPPPLEESDNRVKIKLQGRAGEVKIATNRAAKVLTLCRYYCKKAGLDPNKASNMNLRFDGEKFGPDASVEDMDIEDGDMVDVEGDDL